MNTDTSSKKFFTMPLEKSEFNNWIKPSKTLSPVIKKPKGFSLRKIVVSFELLKQKKSVMGKFMLPWRE